MGSEISTKIWGTHKLDNEHDITVCPVCSDLVSNIDKHLYIYISIVTKSMFFV